MYIDVTIFFLPCIYVVWTIEVTAYLYVAISDILIYGDFHLRGQGHKWISYC